MIDILERNRKLVIVALVAIILYAGWTTKLSLVPGPEGVRALNYGVQVGSYGDVLLPSQLDELPYGYQWGSTSPSLVSVKHLEDVGEPSGGFFLNGPSWWYDHGGGAVRSEVQRPQLQDDPLSIPKDTLEYYKYVRQDENQVEIRKVVVQIVPVDFVIQLSAITGAGVFTFEDLRVWYALDSVTWLNSYLSEPPADPDPLTNSTVKYMSSNFRGAFPIVGWIGEYKDWVWKDEKGNARSIPPSDNALKFTQLEPSLEGRTVDLFTEPGSTYNLLLSRDVVQNPELLAQALSPDGLPDPRFAETVFFYIHMSRFGPYVEPTGLFGSYSSYRVWHPSVWYRLRVVYAIYGEHVYLWTTEAADDVGYNDWDVRETDETGATDPITALLRAAGKWLKNPFNVLGLGTFFMVLVFGLAALVLYWRFGPPAGRED